MEILERMCLLMEGGGGVGCGGGGGRVVIKHFSARVRVRVILPLLKELHRQRNSRAVPGCVH